MDHLPQLCEDLNLDPTLVTEEDGAKFFPLTDDLLIKVKQLDPGVFLYSPIAPCPEIKREILFIHLMKGNLFGQGTLGGAIAYNEEENLLTLSSHIPYDMKYRFFRESIEDFANIVMFWRQEIDKHIKEAEGGIL